MRKPAKDGASRVYKDVYKGISLCTQAIILLFEEVFRY